MTRFCNIIMHFKTIKNRLVLFPCFHFMKFGLKLKSDVEYQNEVKLIFDAI